MVRIKIKPKTEKQFKTPLPGWAMAKLCHSFKPLAFLMDKVETMWFRKKIDKLTVDRPIYITGVARSGTTITLTMLTEHPDLASHRYMHMPMPYLPYIFGQLVSRINLYTTPMERIHKDTIMVTRDSPDALEEIFWQTFFDTIHNENVSNVFDGNISNPKFERFYRDHIRKLIISQNATRYLTKNNYVATRMEYVHRIFPSAKFLLFIRNPVTHIASLIKQTLLFLEIEREDPLLIDWTKIIGHREFGHAKVCINVGDTELIHKVRNLWKDKDTYVKGWAYYWASLYDYIANCLDTNKKLKKAALIIRYEDLCGTPAKTIDKILKHTELSVKKFEKVKREYTKKLCQPTYYNPVFSEHELADIEEITQSTAARFGYKKIL